MRERERERERKRAFLSLVGCLTPQQHICLSQGWTGGRTGMGIKNGKVSAKVGAWGPQKTPSGDPGGNSPGGGQGAKPPEAF